MVIYTLPTIREVLQERAEITIHFQTQYDLRDLLSHCCHFLTSLHGDVFSPRRIENLEFLTEGFSEMYALTNGLDQKVKLFEGDPGTYIDGIEFTIELNNSRTACTSPDVSYIRGNRIEESTQWHEKQEPLPKWCSEDYFPFFGDHHPYFILTFPNGMEVLRKFCAQKKKN